MTSFRIGQDFFGSCAEKSSVVAAVDFEQEPQSVYVSGSYAYVVTGFRVGNGLFAFDVSNPRNPVQVGAMGCDFPADLSCSTPVDIHVSGSYAYLADSGIVVVDITDTTKPVVVGEVKKDGTSQAMSCQTLREKDLRPLSPPKRGQAIAGSRNPGISIISLTPGPCSAGDLRGRQPKRPQGAGRQAPIFDSPKHVCSHGESVSFSCQQAT